MKSLAQIISADPLFAQYIRDETSAQSKASFIAEEIGQNHEVIAVILFGSTAKAKATRESDIDLLIITETNVEDILNDRVCELMFRYNVPVEAIIFTYDDLLANLQAKTTLFFGLLEGYQVLHDRGGIEEMLSIKKNEIRKAWIYDKEAQTWIQRKLLPISK